ncbi:hypothetical protein BZG36_03844 [Bifiguratus adelaidae]|uniref:K Homology domain-containing protein n=1 Tax=Bifiguratus adelaidae TaxID=1938954 RepID=A0A261XW80_9FUNG|nr:hypothetical protein BZG36_03844 [Bifiguratus adelaidae]
MENNHTPPTTNGITTNGTFAAISEQNFSLRALVTTKEAGVIIGKAGKNVNELRDQTGVKAGVSKVVQGINDRVLTLSGTLSGIARAFGIIAQNLLENPTTTPPSTPILPRTNLATTSAIRLLISHNLMGSIIGRQGAKIKRIQETTEVRMIASKDMLPQSTERVVEVQGHPDAIRRAIEEIGLSLIEDWERGAGTVLYNPARAGAAMYTDRRVLPIQRTGNGSDFNLRPRREETNQNATVSDDPKIQTQNISIPADMVGCIIGRGGSKISEIRNISGSRISIAKVPHDETGERMFTIQGTKEANEKALYLLYGQLEAEKERRLGDQEE